MTIHVSTRVARADEPTILTLEGVADNGLLAMLADGIASLASSERSLVVDVSSLTSRSHGDGPALLARLLDGRCPGRVMLRCFSSGG